MGMRRSDLPFELQFYFSSDGQEDKFVAMDDFVEDPEDVQSSHVTLRELGNVKVKLFARSRGPLRLYLDGLECCSDPNIQQDEKGYWLPEGKEITLSSYDDDNPWVPGYYAVSVCSREESYHNLLYVCPKGMTTHQLELMRQEIEEMVSGLAMDMVGRNTLNLSAQDYFRFQLLWQNFPQLCSAVTDILERPSQQAARNWQVVPLGCARRIGPQSISWLARHPEHMAHSAPRCILSGKSTVLYDLPENRWLAGFLDQIIAFLGKVAARDRDKSSRAEHMQERLRVLRKRPPLGELEGEGVAWSLTMFKDGRYRLFYELWRQIFKPRAVYFRGKLGWKRTDLLFEYWCYLRTIVALSELGFTLTAEGNLLQGQLEKEDIVVSLAAGAKVNLVRGTQKVVVAYNESLPHTTAEAREKGHFLRMASPHNQPDIRLDFYENGEYTYTTILDAKYRPPERIWDRRAFTGERIWPEAMKQISDYKNSLYNINQPNLRCVREAALICTSFDQADLDYDADFNLALVMEKPGEGGEVLKKYLAEKVIA